MRGLGLLLLVTALSGLGAGVGCYTMLRHPSADLPMDGQSDEDSYSLGASGRACVDCHADTDYYHWTDPYYRSFYGYYPSPWASYYLHPWWMDDSARHSQPADTTGSVLGPGRHAWERGPGNPFVPRVGGPGFVPAPTPEPKVPAPAPPDTTRQPVPGRKNEREEPKRSAWGR